MNTNLVTLLMVVGTLGGITSGLAQTKTSSPPPATTVSPPATSGARIQFAELARDFGRLSSGDVVRHDFVFTNTGNATLEIKDVRPGCGCTTAGIWDRRVEPGKTGVIPVQFNSTGFNGTISKTVIVICNDPVQTNVVLQVKGLIWKPIEVTPAMAVFNVFSEGQTNDTRTMRIVNHLDDPIELSDVKSTNQSFQAELTTVKPGKEFELHVKAVPPYTSNTAATVSVKTSAPQMPMINVSAYIVVQQAVIVAPAQITVPTGRLSGGLSSSVKILNRGTNALALSEPRVNSPGIEVRLQEVQPGQVFGLSKLPRGVPNPARQECRGDCKIQSPRIPAYQGARNPTSSRRSFGTSARARQAIDRVGGKMSPISTIVRPVPTTKGLMQTRLSLETALTSSKRNTNPTMGPKAARLFEGMMRKHSTTPPL